MTELFIIGTGGAAKEIIQLVEQINELKPVFELKGFVDIDTKKKEIQFFGKTYLLMAEAEFIESEKNVNVIVANGNALTRAKVYNLYKNFTFPNLIHPVVEIHASVVLGVGNIIKMGCIITTDILIGDNNYINRGVQIGHDIKIGSHNVFNPASVISGGVELGTRNNIGANATILPYKKVGNENTLGAGAVLAQDTTDGNLLIGIPAKIKE